MLKNLNCGLLIAIIFLVFSILTASSITLVILYFNKKLEASKTALYKQQKETLEAQTWVVKLDMKNKALQSEIADYKLLHRIMDDLKK